MTDGIEDLYRKLVQRSEHGRVYGKREHVLTTPTRDEQTRLDDFRAYLLHFGPMKIPEAMRVASRGFGIRQWVARAIINNWITKGEIPHSWKRPKGAPGRLTLHVGGDEK